MVIVLGARQMNEKAAPPLVATAPPLPAVPISIASAAIRGSDDAKVVLIAYSDFECPYCRSFAQKTMPLLEERYIKPGYLALVFKHSPLESIHPAALGAAQAAECARQQGRFWQMHDKLFEAQRTIREMEWTALATSIGLNPISFEECLSTQGAAAVRADLALAQSLSVRGTPAFFVGTKNVEGSVILVQRLSGDQPLANFSEVIDPILTKQGVAMKKLVQIP